MGIVYKLKQEVIDFIVTEKQNNPSLSCRRLSDITKEKFQIDVSKSSINAIIKKASLSSPVGRRSDAAPTAKKFKIPKGKKDELLSLTQPSLPPHPPEPPPVILLPEPPQEFPQSSMDIEEKKEEKKMAPSDIEIPPELAKPPFVVETAEDQKEPVPPQETEEEPEKEPEESPEERPHLNLEPSEEIPLLVDEKPAAAEIIEETALPQNEEPQESKPEEIPPPVVEEQRNETVAEPQKSQEEPIITPQPEPEIPQAPLAAETPSLSKLPEEVKTPVPESESPSEASFLVVSPIQRAKEIPLLDGMGCFFLKAAEWELANSTIPGGLLRKHSKYFSPNINDIGEALLYLSAFGINSLEGLKSYTHEGLWALNHITEKIGQDVFEKLANSIENPKALSLGLSQEYSQIFSEVGFIKMIFSDGDQICFDGQERTVWMENDVPSFFSAPLSRVLNVLSEQFISNTRPVILLTAPGLKSFGKVFYDMMTAFENSIERPIARMAIHDIDKNEIAKFTTIPSKRRQFIAGAWPSQEEFKQLASEDLRRVKTFSVSGINQEIYYSELKTRLGQQTIGQGIGVRVFLLRESAEDWPSFGIITNIPEEKMISQDVIASYLSRWPNLKEGYDDFTAKTQKAAFGTMSNVISLAGVPLLGGKGYFNILDNPNLWQDMQFLLSSLSRYCQRRFFPAHYEALEFLDLKERFYGLEGVVERAAGLITVTLQVPSGYAHRSDLEYAIRRLNESDIRDYSATRLIAKISDR